MAFNLNICHILDVGSPPAIFHHLCHSPRGVAISRHFCQILPFSRKSPLSKGPLMSSNWSRQPSGNFSSLRAFLDISDLMTVQLFFIKQQEIHCVNKLLEVAFSSCMTPIKTLTNLRVDWSQSVTKLNIFLKVFCRYSNKKNLNAFE